MSAGPPLSRLTAGLQTDTIGPRCLVTGARGFLGARLVEALVELGCMVVAVDDRRTPRDEQPGVVHKKVDITSRRAVDDLLAFHPVDTVFHCARAGATEAPERVMRLHVVGTATLLAGVRVSEATRFVHVGHLAVNAGTVDPFVRSLRYAEQAVQGAEGVGGLRTLVVRPATLWGPGGAFLEQVMDALVAGRTVPAESMDRAHVDTVVRALLYGVAAVGDSAKMASGKVFPVTDAQPMPTAAWLAPVVQALGYPPLKGATGGRPAVDVAASQAALGWAPVVDRDTGLAELDDVLHALHIAAVARAGAGSLPFRAPDFALAEATTPTLTFVLWDRARSDRGRRAERVEQQVAPALEGALSPTALTVMVDGPHSRVPSPSPFPLGARPVAGLVTLQTDHPDAPSVVQTLLSRHGFDCAGYRVAESVYRDHGDSGRNAPRDWPDRTRSPGVVMVGICEKKPIVAYDAWLSGWWDHVAALTERILPRTRYVRQRVLEPVTEGAPPFAGFALESFPDPHDIRSKMRFYGASSVVELVRNMVRVMWAAAKVFPITRAWSPVLSETVWISPPAASVGGGAVDHIGAPREE